MTPIKPIPIKPNTNEGSGMAGGDVEEMGDMGIMGIGIGVGVGEGVEIGGSNVGVKENPEIVVREG